MVPESNPVESQRQVKDGIPATKAFSQVNLKRTFELVRELSNKGNMDELVEHRELRFGMR